VACDGRSRTARGPAGRGALRRDRYDLYKAKAYGGRPTSPARLSELEHAYDRAKARLDWAEQESASHDHD